MIAATGGTPGTEEYRRLSSDPVVQSMSRTDFLIILGNCGITAARGDFSEAVRLYRSLPCSVLFLDGASDDYDLLADFPPFPWNGGMTQNISRGITRLMRGQVFTLSGKTFFVMGGAGTPGRTDSERYYTWWPEQDISQADVETGMENLDRCGRRVDYILTCARPSKWGGRSEELDAFTDINYGIWIFADSDERKEYPEYGAVCPGHTVVRLL
jgi:hypothetical protein